MPAVYKNSKYQHRGGVWTWDSAYTNSKDFGKGKCIAIFFMTLIVIDLDNFKLTEQHDEEFPILMSTSRN